ncbi:MAG TPA: LLM class flavin-dependent oxidoreductase [Acidimicrobiales bacterium]|nr:LLM class flavin-dependent oxidoreductase [Acidimicrobiales bacterium]
MNFFFFHLMPWPNLAPPREFLAEHEAAWVTLSNAEYDPVAGQDLYRRYLDELVYAEELGFDGLVVNEHHQNAYGLMPSPNLVAAALTQRTERAKICVLGNAVTLYNPPTRVAEEMAMLDVMSGGRLIAGLVVGGGPEYYSYNVNPTEARPRFKEALDLVVKAWTTPGPFAYDGDYYHLPYVNPWPRPLQQPHPPVWIPGLGSPSTIEFCADKGFGYMGVAYYAPPETFGRQAQAYHAAVAAAGRPYDPELLGWLTTIYVAETDDRAVEEAAPHMAYFQANLAAGFVGAGKVWMPPGYIDPPALVQFLDDLRAQAEGPRPSDPREAMAARSPLVGSPETVRQRLADYVKRHKIGTVLGLLQFGSLPADLTARSMRLYAEEVIPYVRKEADEHFAREGLMRP